MAIKPTKREEYKEVTYSSRRWAQLKELRCKAVCIMAALETFHLHSLTHGSIARGDVNKGSDVDVFIPEVQNSFLVETSLEKAKIPINSRLVVQATPTYAMKAHIEIDECTTVSFPLMEMRRGEREFYRFGGEINLAQLGGNIRVAGVDKRLMLVEPTETGHVESSVVGKEELTANILGVAAETVLDRVHALMKRDFVGRTGVFVKRELTADETFELALKKLSDMNPAVRRRMKKRV
ncbi:MAG TPA: nucleotidyltransferase domain-containing protein [Candidatus Binatia bacterium]|nr:nucleotidyltransferase domain-containing protein [Candidatus Binatia bacterium]